ncbi:hypothetical protein [Hungatella hathewayi]|uniref:hypothetical protein n=1 Tax=Hungatella hathewayi TaxID=154046 RepID=UPI0035640704
MDFKDFITRHKDIKETERIYGKMSDQYKGHQKMNEIKTILQKKSILLGKQCKQEFISVQFIYGQICSYKIKNHWNPEKTEIKKRKEQVYQSMTLNKLADEVFELVWTDGYEII